MSKTYRVRDVTRALDALDPTQRTLLLAAIGVQPVTPKANKYARVPCAYGACSQTFLPNGRGSLQHTTCKQGKAAMDAARASR